MTRPEFTFKLCMLLDEAISNGDMPIIDYVLRSTEEQERLFNAGKSKCDGKTKLSQHQFAKAVDIYFVDKEGNVDWDDSKGLQEKYHKYWESIGGKPMLTWDRGHYE